MLQKAVQVQVVEVREAVKVAHAISVALYLLSAISVVSILGGIVLQLALGGSTAQSTTPDSTNSVTLTWTAPGDDGNIGTVAAYNLRYSTEPLAESTWEAATTAPNPPTPLPAGTTQSMAVTGLSPGMPYSFAIKSTDEAGNQSAISNIASKRTDQVACTPEWSCTDWSECIDSEQTRACIDVAQPACGTDFNRPIEKQSCTTPTPPPAPSSCIERWSCTDWTACVDGFRTRACEDAAKCGTEDKKPETRFDCSAGGEPPENPNEILLATAPAKGGGAEVKVFNAETGRRVARFFAYSRKYRGGLSLAGGDVDRDGHREIVVGTGVGSAPEVSVFTTAGKAKTRFFAFPRRLRTGVNVAASDVDGDGNSDVIVAPAGNYTSLVRVFRYDAVRKRFTRLAEFGALGKRYRGGVNLSVDDLDRNGLAEVIVTPAKGERTGIVEVYEYDLASGTMKKRHSFTAYTARFRSGIETVTADVNGDGHREIITVPAPGATDVRIFTYANRRAKLFGRFMAGGTSFRGGADLASMDMDRDGKDEILTGTFSNGLPGVRAFTHNVLTRKFDRLSSPFPPYVYSPSFRKGIRITAL